MFYLVTGTDTTKAQAKLESLTQAVLTKKPEAEVFFIDDENFSEAGFEELIKSQGLFSAKFVVKAKSLWSEDERAEWLLDKLPQIADSANMFIFQEDKLNKAVLKKLEPLAEKVWTFDLPAETEVKDRFIFSITDAFNARRRKDLWLALAKAQVKVIPAEIVFWHLVGSLRNIILVLDGEDLSELKLHPFVISKTRQAARNFTRSEAQKLLDDLFTLYHNSRRGGLDLYQRLEKFSLEV